MLFRSDAGAGDLGVVDVYGCPIGGDVTIRAERRRRDVVRGLTRRRRAVVAADASP